MRFFLIFLLVATYPLYSWSSDIEINDQYEYLVQNIRNPEIPDQNIIENLKLMEFQNKEYLLEYEEAYDDRTLISHLAIETNRLELFSYLFNNGAKMGYYFKNSILKVSPYFSRKITSRSSGNFVEQLLSPSFIPVFYKVIEKENSKESARKFISFLYARITLNELRKERDGIPEHFSYLRNKEVVNNLVFNNGSIIRTPIEGDIYLSYQQEFPDVLLGRELTPGNLQSKILLPLYQTYTQDELLERFLLIHPLGAGGESNVYEVEDQITGNHYALVIRMGRLKNKTPTYNKKIVDRLVSNQCLNPHQATIYGYFFIKHRDSLSEKYISPFKGLKDGRPLTDFDPSHPTNTSLYETYLLELGIGDLENPICASIGEPNSQSLFRSLSPYFLDMALIDHMDNKPRNNIFVPTSTCRYLGEPMDQYNFLRYEVSGSSLYTPTPLYLLKRIDFGGWRVKNEENSKIHDHEETLHSFLRRTGMFDIFGQKPEGQDLKILEIKNWQQ